MSSDQQKGAMKMLANIIAHSKGGVVDEKNLIQSVQQAVIDLEQFGKILQRTSPAFRDDLPLWECKIKRERALSDLQGKKTLEDVEKFVAPVGLSDCDSLNKLVSWLVINGIIRSPEMRAILYYEGYRFSFGMGKPQEAATEAEA